MWMKKSGISYQQIYMRKNVKLFLLHIVGGLQSCEMLKIIYRLDNQLIGGDQVVSLMRPQRFKPRKIF